MAGLTLVNQPKEQHTCLTKNANEPTRRDCILASPDGLQLVTHFQVTSHDVCSPTTVTMHLDTGDASYYICQARVPGCLADLLEVAFKR